MANISKQVWVIGINMISEQNPSMDVLEKTLADMKFTAIETAKKTVVVE